jgi:hypothetical protein
MTLLEVTANLQTINTLLERIAIALERIAGPAIQPPSPPQQSTLRDYTVFDDEELARAKQASETFAAQNMLVPGSPAYLKAVVDFEELVREMSGPNAVDSLPWKIRGAVAEHDDR